MKVILTRGQIGKSKTGLDITVKSSSGWATDFAPTWDMVAGHKSGVLSNVEYEKLYFDKLSKAEESFKELRELGLKNNNMVKLLCYCSNGKFCHTHLFIDYAVETYPEWFSDGRKSNKKKEDLMKFLLAIDLETTGLKPGYHEITQIAAIMLDKNLNELGTFNTFVKIDHPDRGLENNFNVFEYTGITLESLKKAPVLKEALRSLETFVRSKIGDVNLKQVVIFGQNPAFDKSFLEKAFNDQGWLFPFDFHVVALESMFIHQYLIKNGEIPTDICLKDICKSAGVENKQKHNAMSDIRASVESLQNICPKLQKKQSSVKTDKKPSTSRSRNARKR